MSLEDREAIKRMKTHRRDLDEILQRIKGAPNEPDGNREIALSRTKLEESIMWLGMACKAINEDVSCYKHGYDPTNAKVDAPAHGVKL